jgi:dihydroorotate dehydrogenase (fumarate)
LEVNLYRVAADPRRTANEIEAADLALVAAVRETVTIPVAVKLSPFYTSFAGFAGRMASLGVDGLVVFNRFYQPDLDLASLDVVARVELSRSADLRLPMRWIGILRPQLPQSVSLAATSGVHTGGDVVKAVMVGADVAMMTSALLIHGPGHVRTVEGELRAWMEEHEYDSVAQMRGSATQAAVGDPDAYERANYMQTIHSWATPSVLGGS